MTRQFTHYIARILVLLAIVLPATAQSAEPVLRTLAPSTAGPGEDIIITGENLLPVGGGTIVSTIRYGAAGPVFPLGERPTDLTSWDWSSTRVRVRLPAVIAPGTYWLAVFRDGEWSSNFLLFTVPLIATPPPRIVSAITPVRPGYMIGVFGDSFGERPGRLLLALHLDIGVATYPLTELVWHRRGIAGRIPRIVGVPDGPATLIVERADGRRSEYSSVRFVATREVRRLRAGDIQIVACSNEADTNDCSTRARVPGAPSVYGKHSTVVVIDAGGERGVDEYSFPLADGWRVHDVVYVFGNRGAPPRWRLVDRDSRRPHLRVAWSNPPGFGQHITYGFDIYAIGPAGWH